MKRTVIPLVVIAIVALGLWGRQKLFSGKNNSPVIATTDKSLPGTSSSLGNRTTIGSGTPTVADLPEGTASDRAKKSLNEMSLLLVDAVRGSKNLEKVVQYLKQTGQNPTLTRNANPATGEMVIVRTQSPLPGTRYFHAQYVTDENNQRLVQHMSFEFKPGPSSMSDAVRAAIQNFSVGEPVERYADFIQWELDEDYVLWIRKKSAVDLKNDPFNAQDPKKDIGTVQMAVELKVHDQDDGHGH